MMRVFLVVLAKNSNDTIFIDGQELQLSTSWKEHLNLHQDDMVIQWLPMTGIYMFLVVLLITLYQMTYSGMYLLDDCFIKPITFCHIQGECPWRIRWKAGQKILKLPTI